MRDIEGLPQADIGGHMLPPSMLYKQLSGQGQSVLLCLQLVGTRIK